MAIVIVTVILDPRQFNCDRNTHLLDYLDKNKTFSTVKKFSAYNKSRVAKKFSTHNNKSRKIKILLKGWICRSLDG